MRTLRAASTLVALLTFIFSDLCFAQPDRIAAPINTSHTVALAKSHHFQARPEYDRGRVDPSTKLSYMTLLMAPSPSQQKALDQLLAEQQDQSSPNYHKWLTPQQYADRFGLSQNDLTRIANWLQAEGFHVISVGGGHNDIVFSGTAGQVQHAFGTEIHNYEVDGKMHYANATPVLLPAALNGVVTRVMGLHSFLPRPAVRGNRSGGPVLRPDYYDGNFVFQNFLAPGDIATIYGIDGLYGQSPAIDGTGQKLAIVGETDIYLDDINDFRSGFGLSTIPTSGSGSCATLANGLVTSTSTGCTTTNFAYVVPTGFTDPGVDYLCGDLPEADLDIELSGAVARNAQIVYVNSPTIYDSNCNVVAGGSVFDSLYAVINPPSGPPLAPVVSMSYGICELAGYDFEAFLQQGNAEGVTIVNSSGDTGSATCDTSPPNPNGLNQVNPPFLAAQFGLAVSYPASSPEVTGVGGTAITLADDNYPTPNNPNYWSTTIGANGGTAQSYVPEIMWNDDVQFASYCQSAPTAKFCSQGGTNAITGWVALGTSATPQQVQEDVRIDQGGGGPSNCFYQDVNGVCLGAGAGPSGGGFAQPSYQSQNFAGPITGAPSGVRYVPDISGFGSPDFPGYIFCAPQLYFPNGSLTTSSCANGISQSVDTWTSIVGGTSASTPTFAGIVALLNQYVIEKGVQTTAGLGNINKTLYELAATDASRTNKVFHHTTSGDDVVYCQVGQPDNPPDPFPSNYVCPSSGSFGFQASNADPTTGYNLVNGLGSVDAGNFLAAWVAAAPPFSLSANPTTLSIAQNSQNTSTITVTSINSFNSAVTLSASGQPSGVTVTFGTNPVTPPANGTGTSVMTVKVGASVTAGTYTITVTGTSGSTTATTTVALTVTQNFTATISTNPASANPGQTTTTTMQLTTSDGKSFVNLPKFSCSSGLPTGATCSFSTPTSAASQQITITVNTTGPFSGSATGGVRSRLKTPQPESTVVVAARLAAGGHHARRTGGQAHPAPLPDSRSVPRRRLRRIPRSLRRFQPSICRVGHPGLGDLAVPKSGGSTDTTAAVRGFGQQHLESNRGLGCDGRQRQRLH